MHTPIIGQITLSPSASSLVCKFYHAPPFHVVDYSGQIYYVVHRFQSISRAMIHLGVKHPMVNNKCREYVDKTRRLIIKEVDHTPNAKIYAISLSVSMTFLATHMFDDSGDGLVELLNEKQLKHIQDTFFEMNSSTFVTWLLLSSIIQGMAILIASLN